ncbi:MAG: DUF2961 domain-containing protein [Planctomycetaceae bacterium]|jgi:hypothetical protein|nr:DUF2961 domain-containing protein [Planctomycetaceae bacterium]
MRHTKKLTLVCVAIGAVMSVSQIFSQADAANVTWESLLNEITNRAAISEFPDPFYTNKQASSYDRNAKAAEQPNWFANGDASQFVREETNADFGDRKEWVLIDADGPGAIVRWWITAPHYKTTFRVYFDGEKTPTIETKLDELVGGNFLVGAPLSEANARGRNLYLPIPYAKHIKITVDDMPTQNNLYYQINYRTYESGTNVKTFSIEDLKKLNGLVKQKLERLKNSGRVSFADLAENIEYKTILPGASVVEDHIQKENEAEFKEERGIALVVLMIKLKAENIPQALRSTILHISFDGKETVTCPVGDLFGTGVGLNPYSSWYTSVFKDGWMMSKWFMPFQNSCEIKFQNLSDEKVEYISYGILAPYHWNEKSMYFHSNWRQERDIETIAGNGTKDWNYITIQGKGVFVGDSLSVVNHHTAWWGEGDEKIYIDGEKFPSHFGTGTEDYYGYAWCTPEFFEAPFHAQPRAEGPSNYGNTTNSRYRSLDAIPFTKDFRFDMEVWHWAATKINYSVATYWYALGDATTNQPDNIAEEAKSKVSYETEGFVFNLPGYNVANKPHGNLSIQNMAHFNGKWKNDEQLWWTGATKGDELKLRYKIEQSGKQHIVVSLTKAVDYGQIQFSFDGKEIGNVIDLFNDGVIRTDEIDLGELDVFAGEHILGVKIVGKNEKSTNFLFGLENVEFKLSEK